MRPGTVVRLTRDVERFPDFIAPAGMTGVIVRADCDTVAVRLFMWQRGAEEWDNEVEWYRDSMLGEASEDLEVLT
jgi:hypothetical protein